MTDPFVHLHVASGYSMQHGTALPWRLVERAADHGMDTLALTDRDGLYGAVRFAKACLSAGLHPVLGVDLAVAPSLDDAAGPAGPAGGTLRTGRAPARRTGGPVRGGVAVDPRHPRIVVLAQGRAGWAALCRLVTAVHLAGERGRPVATLDLVAEHAARARDGGPGGGAGALVVLLGTDSEVGRAVARRRPDLATAVLSRWRAALGTGDLVLAATSHLAPGEGPAPYTTSHAARMLRLGHETGLPVVLTHAVRGLDRDDGPVADILDASRRLVVLDTRHVDRVNAEGYLASGKEMAEIAVDVVRAAGLAESAATRLLATTRAVGERCTLDPRADLGLGEVHFPELRLLAGPESRVGSPESSPDTSPDARTALEILRSRCAAGLEGRYSQPNAATRQRLAEELDVIATMGYPSYFLTVADVCDLIRAMDVRVAARGSGAGSLVCYALGISGVDPMRHGLIMERFLSPLRQALPDVDVDVESARRTEVYERILERFGADRVACVSMMDTYRIRHAVRDVGAALGLPPMEIDAIAKAFPHIRARDIRPALAELPELRASGLAASRLEVLVGLVERLDGLPRHIALHPCGIVLSDATLLDRTPVEASFLGFPMSQFDKDDVEDLGLLKLDVLGIRMQSAMQHAVAEIHRVDGAEIDLDDQAQVPLDDPATFALIQSTRTLGCFQIESPGQRELVGKFAPETFDDLIIDISLFRPGPVKSDMVTPFLQARHGWAPTEYLHPDLEPHLRGTSGVVVFHEQVLQIIATLAGCSLAEADEVRRALGDAQGKEEVRVWFHPRALARGYDLGTVRRVWELLESFASFGFCKAHAAAFALPTYQSAWLKAHHPAAFLAGVLTHDPGMYPKRLILDDARNFGIPVLPLDVNASDSEYRVERLDNDADRPEHADHDGHDGRADHAAHDRPLLGIRLSLAEVSGISEAEVARVVAGRPYHSLTDFWRRARVARPVVERLVLAGAFDTLYGVVASDAGSTVGRSRTTRRDLLLQVGDLDRYSRAVDRAARATGLRGRGRRAALSPTGGDGVGEPAPGDEALATANLAGDSVARRTAQQSAGNRPASDRTGVQLSLDLGDVPAEVAGSGLPELTPAERVRAELEILGLDASRHVLDFYGPFLDALGVTRSRDLRRRRSRSELLVAGVKVATQTPPIRSGRRVVFLTLDDSTGPVDATFFEDVQGPYAATVFHSWLLVVRGELRRTGPRGVSLRATGAWELTALHDAWTQAGLPAVAALLTATGNGEADGYSSEAVAGAAESRSTRPVMVRPPVGSSQEWNTVSGYAGPDAEPGTGEPDEGSVGSGAGGMRRRRVLVHPSGFRMSPYADVKPPGGDTAAAPRKLWHASPGSSGR